jgi:hypothetical protein
VARRLQKCSVALVVGIGWFFATGQMAAGQTASTTSSSVAPAATVNQVTLDNNQARELALIALLFGLLAVSAVLIFLSLDRRRSFRLFGEMSERGQTVSGMEEPALDRSPQELEGVDSPAIHGPATVRVGVPVTYTLVGTDASAATWHLLGEATLSATTGPSVRVTATNAGGFRLTAKYGTLPTELPRDLLAEQPATTDTSKVPLLGRGYGTVVIALAVASVTAALGLTKVLDGQAVAGILGSLVTLSVARGTSSAGGGAAAGGATD